MARQPDIAELRRIVRQRHQDATKKISRMRRVNGVDVGGTRYDPRRKLENVKGYNRKQLTTYLRELETFQSRGTSFAVGGGGTILPMEKVREYNRLKRRWNARVDRKMKAIEGVFIEPLGKTVKTRRAERSNEGFAGVGEDATNRVYAKIQRDPLKIRGEANLDKMLKQLRDRFEPGYDAKHLASQRKQFRQMAKAIGAGSELRKLVSKMSDYEFSLFWNETNAAESMGNIYFLFTSADESKRQQFAGIIENNESETLSLARWAKRQGGNGTRRKR